MPYFYSAENKVNILLIHIPKTGGMSLEHYFSDKYNIPLGKKSLYTTGTVGNFTNGISYQHQTYMILKQNKDILDINFDNLTIITIVRNPYERLISHLFYLSCIPQDATPKKVYNTIKRIFDIYKGNDMLHDNHIKPQYLFLLDETGEINKNIKILKTENLDNMMHEHGYSDFNRKHNTNKYNISNTDYMKFLNDDSIFLINTFYDRDFTYFGYAKL